VNGCAPLEEENLDPSTQIVALRGYNTGTLLVKKSPFTEEEMATLRTFSEEKAFDLAFGPGLDDADINRYNILPEPVMMLTSIDTISCRSRFISKHSKIYYQRLPVKISIMSILTLCNPQQMTILSSDITSNGHSWMIFSARWASPGSPLAVRDT